MENVIEKVESQIDELIKTHGIKKRKYRLSIQVNRYS